MLIKTIRQLNRRTFLRGVGGQALLLHLNIMAANSKQPMRMVCVGMNFGFVPKLFFPEQTGRDYTAPELIQQLAQHRDQFTIFSQLDHGAEGVGGHTGVHAFLSGIRSKNSRGRAEKNVTMDQKAAAHVGADTRYSSMQFSAGGDEGMALSWNSSGVALPSQSNLATLYAMLFQSPRPQQLDVLRSHQENEASSIWLSRMRRSCNEGSDARIRRSWINTPLPCANWSASSPSPKPGGQAETAVEYELPADAGGLDFVDRVPLYYDLMKLALQTDSTRVITFSLADIGGNSGGFPLTRGYHQLTHHGKVTSYIKELSIIERFHTKQFGRFLDQLASVREPNGKTLLDNTMALLGSGMGNASSHATRTSRCCCRWRLQTRTTSSPRKRLHAGVQSFVSMLQRFGLETDRFNTATGRLNGLEVA